MDLKKNAIPENVRKIHLTAVCGTAMGALACMLKEMGYVVSGSDQKVYPPMSTFLADRGIRIMDGFHAENIAHEPDLVVIGNTIKKENPEVSAVREKGIPFVPCRRRSIISRQKGKNPLWWPEPTEKRPHLPCWPGCFTMPGLTPPT